jgi:hypothetical protein
MTCAGCDRVNRAESRFCVGCGKLLGPRWPAGVSAVSFVGPEEELARLAAVYEAARAAPAARLAFVLGSSGVGKSRLLDE